MIDLLFILAGAALVLNGVVIGIGIAEWKHRGDW